MDKRTTIHLPAERHRQLREIAARRGFVKITDFLDDIIAREAQALGITSGLITVAPADGGKLMLRVEGMSEVLLSRQYAGDICATVRGELTQAGDYKGWGSDDQPGVLFERRGRGYSLLIQRRAPKNAGGWQWDRERRGFTVSLARELAAEIERVLAA